MSQIQERYLREIENYLKHLEVSQRLEILEEVKNLLDKNLQDYSDRDEAEILEITGAPLDLANRLMAKRGWRRWKVRSKDSGLKWIFIGLGAGLLCLGLAVFLIIWSLRPLIKVDEQKQQIEILGGLVDIKTEDTKNFKLPKGWLNQDEGEGKFLGNLDRKVNEDYTIEIRFNNGRFHLEDSGDGPIEWKCRVDGGVNGKNGQVHETIDSMTIDLTMAFGSRCDVKLPASAFVRVMGMNGAVDVEGMNNNFDINLVNGRVGFRPHPDVDYQYDLKVSLGRTDDFPAGSDKPDRKVKIEVLNGSIEYK